MQHQDCPIKFPSRGSIVYRWWSIGSEIFYLKKSRKEADNTIYMRLCFDLVFAAEHLIDALEIVGSFGDGVYFATWGEGLL